MDLLVCERKLRKCTCTVSYTPMVLKYNEEQIAFRNAIKSIPVYIAYLNTISERMVG